MKDHLVCIKLLLLVSCLEESPNFEHALDEYHAGNHLDYEDQIHGDVVKDNYKLIRAFLIWVCCLFVLE